MKPLKRFCKTLELVDNPELIAEYKRRHTPGAVWPEITEGMKSVGIREMEIYISGTSLFMIMDTVADFDHDGAMKRLADLPRQSEWEALMSRYQKSDPASSAKDKWRIMERIFTLNP
jgi:L-rhamnose mutarotase